jgi:hypothetical protein
MLPEHTSDITVANRNPRHRPWRGAGRTELTTRAVEERLAAYVAALMDAPG